MVLTDAQYESLLSELGEADLSEYIKRVDEYAQETGKTYKDPCLTIRRWYSEDKAKRARAPAAAGKQKKGILKYNDPSRDKEYYRKISNELFDKMMED